MKKEIVTHLVDFVTKKNFFGKLKTRWRIVAGNGEIVGSSTQGYSNRQDVEYNALSVAYSILRHFAVVDSEGTHLVRNMERDSARKAGGYAVLINGSLKDRAFWESRSGSFGKSYQYGLDGDLITHVEE